MCAECRGVLAEALQLPPALDYQVTCIPHQALNMCCIIFDHSCPMNALQMTIWQGGAAVLA